MARPGTHGRVVAATSDVEDGTMRSATSIAVDRSTVLGKVALVLFAFRADDHGVTQAELGRRTGLSKGSLNRILGDLVEVRLLDRVDRLYRLSGQMFQLGMRASAERELLEAATPFMEDLYELTHETVHLGVLAEDSVVYIAKIGGHRQAAAPSRVGGRMPLHCTAIGKVLLALAPQEQWGRVVEAGLCRRTPRTVTAPGLLLRQLRRVRDTRIAFEHEESAVGIACVAAPVLDLQGSAVGALSVTGPSTRFRPEAVASAVSVAAAGAAAVLASRPGRLAPGDASR